MQADPPQPTNTNQETPQPLVKKKRKPPRRLPVPVQRKDIWRRLMQVDAGLTIADWLSMDRQAYMDIRDGLRYLYGRKPKAQVAGVQGVGVQGAAPVNLINQDLSSEDSWSDGSDFEDYESEDGEFNVHSEIDAYDSDDTEADYPYDYAKMRKSRPLRAPIVIHGECIDAIFDTGASVSVISKKLADKLHLCDGC
ncbi:hypothetical protein O0I10_012296 [Lichtheimia ornata]|uniref:Uncharacterized protein n=1 Tax=Lichtheimia ornata TaxID=688661 RepID=A0AAD7UTP3_9FUNG|nr:uncharacterized protein O0I10_012296 [Lichtheimia ornata]KAJ8652106.1 hypothetical protein O0I10_012296 [Lichtheimia ornata]